MKLIAQIAAGVLLALLAMHGIESLEAHLALQQASKALGRPTVSPSSSPSTPASRAYSAPTTPAGTDLDSGLRADHAAAQADEDRAMPPQNPNFVRKATPADAATKPAR